MSGLLLIVAPSVLVTATISGVFGMAGGMILMGVYALALPVAAAMVLHGVTQLASNGSRAVLFRSHIYWPAVRFYLAGAAIAVASFALLAIEVDRRTLLIVLGGTPLVVAALPRRLGLSIQSRPAAVACGAVVTVAQLIAGVSGPLLDLFFVRGSLDRYQVIGTKAITQCIGHSLKLAYYGALLSAGEGAVPAWLYPIAIALAFAGTRIGKAILAHVSDTRFRQYSTAIVLAMGCVYVARGLL